MPSRMARASMSSVQLPAPARCLPRFLRVVLASYVPFSGVSAAVASFGSGGRALNQAFERAGRDDARDLEARRREEYAELPLGAFAPAGHDEHLKVGHH